MYNSVLVATDGSADASRAAERAVMLTQTLEIPLHGISVIETRTAYDNAIVDSETVKRALRAHAEAALEDLEETARRGGSPVTTDCRVGVPHEEILGYAEEHGIDLLVVGSTGRSSFKEALLGSTVDAVVRLFDGDVLVVGGESANA